MAERALYPYINDLSDHISNLEAFGKAVEKHRTESPKEVLDASIDPPKLIYRSKEMPGEVMDLVWDVYRFAIPLFREQMDKAGQIRMEVLPAIQLEPVGLEPLSKMEGYLILRAARMLRLYQYRIRLISQPREERRYFDVVTHYLEERHLSYISTAESVKYELIRRKPEMPNPAVYQVICEKPYPLMETVLPLSKEKLLERSSSSDLTGKV